MTPLNFDFITADWHLGENRFEIMQRPFQTHSEHVAALIGNYNAVVKPDDRVLFLGDAVYQKTPQYLELVSMFNGKKTIVRGNHDEVFSDKELKKYFEHVIPHGEGIEVIPSHKYLPLGSSQNKSYWATHYPTRARTDMFNLVGHIHSSWKVQLNMLNVGVDVHHFRPVMMKDIEFFVNAITSFYDADVWVAYDESNARYRETRGKKTNYYDELQKGE